MSEREAEARSAQSRADHPRQAAPTPSAGLEKSATRQQLTGNGELDAISAPSVRVAVISDLNAAYGSLDYGLAVHDATRALVERIQPDLVLITGDMVAGQKRGLDYGGMWRAFHDAVTTPLLAANIPVMPTPGNHDASPAPSFAVERAEYVDQWRHRERPDSVRFIDRSHYPLRYSFEHSGVFFASLDAAAVGPIGPEQRAWLDAQLTETKANVKIVFGHLPVHPFAIEREHEILGDDALTKILGRHSVTAYISGHHHAYYPGMVDGVRHVAMPCLGAGPRKLVGDSRRSGQALVVLDIVGETVQSLEAWRAPHFESYVPRPSLPESLSFGEHLVVRDDVAGFYPTHSGAARPWAPLNGRP